MRKLLKRAMPVLCSIIIVLGTVFGSYTQAHATGLGITEMIYYTYWDLINTIYASCGYDMSVSDTQINNHGVTGKQAWDNFCTAVEGTAKMHGKLFKGGLEELEGLASNATAKGLSMSQDLYDMLKDCLYYSTNSLPPDGKCSDVSYLTNQFMVSSDTKDANRDRAFQLICNVTGLSSDYDGYSNVRSCGVLTDAVYYGKLLNIVFCPGKYPCYYFYSSYYSLSWDPSNHIFYYYDSSGKKCKAYCERIVINSVEKEVTSETGTFSLSNFNWVMRNGSFFSHTATTSKVSSVSPPKVVPKVMKWTKCKDVPNIYRQVKLKEKEDHSIYVPGVGDVTNWDVWKDSLKDRTTTDAEEKLWNSQYHFEDNDGDDDNDNKNDNNQDERLPAAIPIFADMGTKPDPEPDTEEPTENPDKDDDKKQDSSETTGSVFPMINPDTGNYVDPKTGYDIDPDTGYLIDPKTGDLIDPESGEVVQPGSGGGSGSGSGGSGVSPPGKFSNITKCFPFCIPWDIMTLIKSMNADKKAPHFTFEYHFESIDYTFKIDVDMSDYWKYIKIFRWGMTIFFIIGLFFLTVKFTTFVYRMGG